ncbi:hypothetical protein EQM14_00365 [Caproiciproducens sp. NJN-50]|uniref:hypothetical protein n=1 Tax=Acutalibacteraceae TaxID=3082771 RepID=UPI000FFE2C7E|nr:MULTISPECIES: hypothetical protein [Acutalibacteraceae]QAT48354.1 hypothetical protein EQM14_00365 [Caproiciproducens sp. NJN-50]
MQLAPRRAQDASLAYGSHDCDRAACLAEPLALGRFFYGTAKAPNGDSSVTLPGVSPVLSRRNLLRAKVERAKDGRCSRKFMSLRPRPP